MTLHELDYAEQTIIQALRTAGHQYALDASEMHRAGQFGVSEQFVKQSREVLEIADRIEVEGFSK